MLTELGVIEVTGPGAEPRLLRAGERMTFGRGPQVDLVLGPDPWLSRRAGEICAFDDGVRVTNLSTKHSLYVQVNGDTIRLPTLSPGTGNIGCFLVAGAATVGTTAVPGTDQSVRIVLPASWPLDPVESSAPSVRAPTTVLPMTLDTLTKEFMVAFLLCRPWLLDASRMAPLPSAPRIAEEALRVTGSHHALRLFSSDPEERQRLSAQVHEHLKGLRAKIRKRALVSADHDLTNTAVASVLLHYDIITVGHLALPLDHAWLSAQENKWWGRHP
jgi:hypothetical protein